MSDCDDSSTGVGFRRPSLFRAAVRTRLVTRVAREKNVSRLEARRLVEDAIDDNVIEAAADQVGTPTGAGAVDWGSVIEFILKIIEILLPLIMLL